MAKRVKGSSNRIDHEEILDRPTRTFDQLATDLLPAIEQSRDMVDAIVINTPPPRHDLAWLSSVFSDYRIHLKTRLAELVAIGGEPSDLFLVYDKHLASMLYILAALGGDERVDGKAVTGLCIFLENLPSETLLFN